MSDRRRYRPWFRAHRQTAGETAEHEPWFGGPYTRVSQWEWLYYDLLRALARPLDPEGGRRLPPMFYLHIGL